MTKPCEVSDETSTSFPALSGVCDTPRVTRRARDIRIPESATPRPRGAKKPSGHCEHGVESL